MFPRQNLTPDFNRAVLAQSRGQLFLRSLASFARLSLFFWQTNHFQLFLISTLHFYFEIKNRLEKISSYALLQMKCFRIHFSQSVNNIDDCFFKISTHVSISEKHLDDIFFPLNYFWTFPRKVNGCWRKFMSRQAMT